MTKRDYMLIAQTFAHMLDKNNQPAERPEDELFGRWEGLCDAARQFAHVLAQENPRFDRDRFLKACGVTQ